MKKQNKKKKAIKINFRYFWWYFNPEDNLFTNLLRKDYNVIISDKPDYVFYCVFDGKRSSQSKYLGGIAGFIKSKFPSLYVLLKKIYFYKKEMWKMPVLKGDFVKIFYTCENSRPNMNKCDWAFTYEYNQTCFDDIHLHFISDRHRQSHLKIPLFMDVLR